MSSCFYHTSQEAVAQCQRCGKNLCKSCSKTYGFHPSDWHGKALCPKCTRDVLSTERAEMEKYRSEHIGRIIGTAIGMAIGLVAGIMIGKKTGDGTAIYAILLTLVGGAIVGSINAVLKALVTVFKSVIVGTLGGYFSDNPMIGFFLALPMLVWALLKAIILIVAEIIKSLYSTVKSFIWIAKYSRSVKQYDDSLAKLSQ